MNYDNAVVDPLIPVSAKATIEPSTEINVIPKDRQFRQVLDKFEPLNIAPILPMLTYIRVGETSDFGYWRLGTHRGDIESNVYLGKKEEAVLCKIESYAYIYRHSRAQALVRIFVKSPRTPYDFWLPVQIGPSGMLNVEEIKPYENYEPTFHNPDIFMVGVHPEYRESNGVVLKHEVTGMYIKPRNSAARDGSDQYALEAFGETSYDAPPIYFVNPDLLKNNLQRGQRMRAPGPIAIADPSVPVQPYFPERMRIGVYEPPETVEDMTKTSNLFGQWRPPRNNSDWLAKSYARNAETPFTNPY